jgi:hypothetical protein
MPVHIPLTAATTVIGSLIMGYAWVYLGLQIGIHRNSIQRSVRFVHKFFLSMMFFFIIMSVPYIWTNNPEKFSVSAAWAYVVGHIFMYLGVMYISRMTFALIPRLSSYDKPLTAVWVLATAIVTGINAKTMIWGVQPTYNYKLHLTEFHTSPMVGIPLATMAAFAFIPAIILFILSAVRARGIDRIKPLLLSLGFLLITTAGPLHDNARTAQLYAIADVFTTLGMIITLLGVTFHIESGLREARPRRATIHAPSNTV